jgi:DNA helicase-2/ATP-dependent DNA helicase PcrA
MSESVLIADDNHADDRVEDAIKVFLDLDHPVSFFLFAGAGSGKTRSLINALSYLRDKSGGYLRLYGKRIGVITYTNAACDEIKRRIRFDPLFEVSTIHSFVWSLIGGLHLDIKRWLHTDLEQRLAELREEQRTGRPGTKATLAREESIRSKERRLANLDSIKRFTYNPVGDNRSRDALSHNEVIEIGADFLTVKPVMQRILVDKFPVLLIDESQDTNKLLMEAFLQLQPKYKGQFCLGLIGDVMQRIYADGKVDLGRGLPADWVRPEKRLNHRCPRRIIRLINKIRASADDHVQVARSDSEEGFVRLFVLPSGTTEKPGAELRAAERMAIVTGDPLWKDEGHVKHLMLEHHMVARRMGFLEMFAPLYAVDSFQTGLREGSLPGLRFFSQLVLPLVEAKRRGDEFAVASIVRKNSPLLNDSALRAAGSHQGKQVKGAREAIEKLIALFSGEKGPRFFDVLRWACETQLFEIPESLQPLTAQFRAEGENSEIEASGGTDDDVAIRAWNEFLMAPFAQVGPYDEYVNGRAPFETHQGVKGLEFDRVMVIADDSEARGFMFSYDKLFGAKTKSQGDLDNERQGKETSIDRTRRLFYVTCSRAKKSLAIVAYAADPEAIKRHVVHEGWFENDEVEVSR